MAKKARAGPILVSPLSSARPEHEPHEADRYRELLNLVNAIVWRGNADTFQFTFISHYAKTLLGYPVQRWIDEPTFWRDHIHPDDQERTVQFCEKAAAEKKTHEFDYRMIAADGRVVWLHDVVYVLVENDRPTELVGVMVDISGQKRAEEFVAQSENRLRLMIDAIPEQIWSGPADGSLDFANERWRSYMGLSMEELQGSGWQEMLHPDDRQRVLKAWHESVTQGTPYEQEERHRGVDGQYRWFLSRGLPLRDSERRIVRWFGTNTDIEDCKRAAQEWRESERRWRAVFDNSNVGVALLDESTRYLAVNASYERMLGYTQDEMRALTLHDVAYSEQDAAAAQGPFQDLLAGKRDHFAVERRNRRKDGTALWVRASGSLVPASEGRPRFLVTVVEDITERKRLFDRLALERDRLRLLLNLSGQFASHLELRDLFNALATGLRELEGWEYSALLLPDPTGDLLRVYLKEGEAGPLKEGMTKPVEGTSSGKVYRSGEPEVFRFQDMPPAPSESPALHEFIKSEGLEVGCTLPLKHSGRVLGVLSLATRKEWESAERDLNFLQQLADMVAVALNNALRYGELSDSMEKLEHEKKTIERQIWSEFDCEGIIGASTGLRKVLRQVRAVGPTDSTVLILGETGTGKELIARAIHNLSSRSGQSFIKVDVSAIPSALIESELFGHEKGAFTGATNQKMGRFEVADKGTLFLDEVGDLPLALQTKLLRVLQDHAFERLGSSRTRRVDVRIIAATNRDLKKMVDNGDFRSDLYYRLKVFPIEVPPLRDRAEDIPLLVWHYVKKYAQRMKKRITEIPSRALDVFTRYPWPGNVRELQHFIERAVILTAGPVLRAPLAELEEVIQGMQKQPEKSAPTRTLEEIERDSILQALRESGWVVGGPNGAAAMLGIKRTTLASRMEKLGISRPRH